MNGFKIVAFGWTLVGLLFISTDKPKKKLNKIAMKTFKINKLASVIVQTIISIITYMAVTT